MLKFQRSVQAPPPQKAPSEGVGQSHMVCALYIEFGPGLSWALVRGKTGAGAGHTQMPHGRRREQTSSTEGTLGKHQMNTCKTHSGLCWAWHISGPLQGLEGQVAWQECACVLRPRTVVREGRGFDG